MWIRKITGEQRTAILERFGTEPEPYEWSEQDVVVQIQNFLGCGEFVKTPINSGSSEVFPPGVDF